MKHKKPSEIFEGQNSSLRKTFDKKVATENKCEHGNSGICLACYNQRVILPKQSESWHWEKELEEICRTWICRNDIKLGASSKLYYFISKIRQEAIQEERERIAEKIKGMRKEYTEHISGDEEATKYINHNELGYNTAFSDFLAIINNKE